MARFIVGLLLTIGITAGCGSATAEGEGAAATPPAAEKIVADTGGASEAVAETGSCPGAAGGECCGGGDGACAKAAEARGTECPCQRRRRLQQKAEALAAEE